MRKKKEEERQQQQQEQGKLMHTRRMKGSALTLFHGIFALRIITSLLEKQTQNFSRVLLFVIKKGKSVRCSLKRHLIRSLRMSSEAMPTTHRLLDLKRRVTCTAVSIGTRRRLTCDRREGKKGVITDRAHSAGGHDGV